jgi:site-specific DNA-methyltransferase (adenine-specific)
MSPQGFAGSHYATFPVALPTRLIKAMCPERVCTVCGAPSERITDRSYIGAKSAKPYEPHVWASGIADGKGGHSNKAPDEGARVIAETVGWTDCGHNAWRTGRVLDPFAGSGTTLVAAHNESRDALGIDLDSRNVAMVEDRLGPLVAACDLTVLR